MKLKLLLFSLLLFSSSFINAQTLFIENFDYPAGDSLRAHGWNLTGTSTVNTVLVAEPGLTYTDYPLSGIGNAAYLKSKGEDVNNELSDSVYEGSVYLSAMVRVDSVATSFGDYFMHFGISTTEPNYYFARAFVKKDSGNIAFGTSKSIVNTDIRPNFTEAVYHLNTTYLLVLKYSFSNLSQNDDSVFLFVNPDISSNEPVPDVINTSDILDPLSIKTINLRQGSDSSGVRVSVDGIKVTRRWSDIITGIKEENPVSPANFVLSQNYPNPFNPATTISYSIPQAAGMVPVQLKVYDLLGNLVTTLVNEKKGTGNYNVVFDASRYSSGVYFYELRAGDFVSSKKMILMK